MDLNLYFPHIKVSLSRQWNIGRNRNPDGMNAFRQNLLRLIDMIEDDGGCVLLLPWRGKPNTHPKYQAMIEKNEAVLLAIASKKNWLLLRFPYQSLVMIIGQSRELLQQKFDYS